MPLETAHPVRRHRRWLDGVEPVHPVPRVPVRLIKTVSQPSARLQPEQREPSAKRPSERSPLFMESVSSVEGEKPPSWMLPLFGFVFLVVVLAALGNYYQW